MKDLIKKFFSHLDYIVPAVGIFLAINSLTSTSLTFIYQPDVPEDLTEIYYDRYQ